MQLSCTALCTCALTVEVVIMLWADLAVEHSFNPYKNIFGMAAMPFPFNGILLIQDNLPRVFPMFTLNYASFLNYWLNYWHNLDNK